MEGRPLANQLGPYQRIDDFVGRNTGKLIRGGVADTIAAGLNRMQLHRCQFGEDVGKVFQLRPIELDILAGAEVPITPVILARDKAQLAQLPR